MTERASDAVLVLMLVDYYLDSLRENGQPKDTMGGIGCLFFF